MLLERRLTELQKENATLKAQVYALRLRYGEIGYPITAAQVQQNQLLQLQDQLVQQQVQTQAMSATSNLLKPDSYIKVKQECATPPVPKRAHIVQEVLLPDGRKMALQKPPSPEAKSSLKLQNLQPLRVTSPTPSDTNSDEQVIVDDSDDPTPTLPLGKSSSSGVSSDNESNSNHKSNEISVDDKPCATHEDDHAALTEYYKHQLAALYVQQPGLLNNGLLNTGMAMNLMTHQS